MEGLIPLVYKAIKRSNTRRKYECLSSGQAAKGYNLAELQTDRHIYLGPPPEKFPELNEKYDGRRRSKSVKEFSAGGFYSPQPTGKGPRLSKELAGFRSHRMFSCINGA
ncbi:PREDICTED: uncharacterized protein LOC104612189 [Nelumbo nucifera]|uniref:Uncharacterized protein n=2 Tax=Nelumbo nucifera TaxID=4432 RepID=A0A822Y0R5_NELNU|nr:PREDICTED: uncharacterized protein LOC104612189 [Nelumbo nucifera]DAD25101.1 TPA_asm: hypothetical protein HUJ06_026565 [Nelumbo nucifera]